MNLRLVYGLENYPDDEALAFNLDLIQKVNNEVCPVTIKQAYDYYLSICRKPQQFTVKGLVPPKAMFKSSGKYDIINTLWLLCDDDVEYYWGTGETTEALETILQKGQSHLEWLCKL